MMKMPKGMPKPKMGNTSTSKGPKKGGGRKGC